MTIKYERGVVEAGEDRIHWTIEVESAENRVVAIHIKSELDRETVTVPRAAIPRLAEQFMWTAVHKMGIPVPCWYWDEDRWIEEHPELRAETKP